MGLSYGWWLRIYSFTKQKQVSDIKEIRLWMSQNFLKLNENKTEFIVFGTTVQLSKLKLSTLAVGDSSVNLSSKVRNLGAIFGNKMKLISHVNTVCQKAHNQLRNIGKIQFE